MAASQAEIARAFGKSQPWVSLHQNRKRDPMPRDLDGALAWGRRLGLLTSSAPVPPVDAPLLGENPSAGAVVSLEEADIALKVKRAEEIQARMDLQAGRLIRKEDVERRELTAAVEFRRMACEFPLRARAILDRHESDAAKVERIMADLQPLAAELLNHADPVGVLRGKTPDEIRAALLARVDELCAIV